MNTLFRALGEDVAVQKIHEALQKTGGSTFVYGLSGSQKHAVYASAFETAPRPTVVLVHNREAMDGWCENLESPAPSNKEADRWEAIFEEWRMAMGGKTKPKTRRQIIRWLQNPHTDSAEYKAYGNSIVAQCAFFVLAGIVWAMEEGEQK